MAVAQATFRFLGLSGRVYCVNAYLNDTSANPVRFDEAKIAVAGSADNYIPKENCTLVDVALTSDLATPTSLQLVRNGTPTGDILDCTAQLVSVTNRPNPRLKLAGGDKFSVIQL